MGYSQAMGDLAPSDWNSTKYPGVCKPTNFDALAVSKGLQTQLNRLAQAQGLAKIPVDGDIGPGTLKLMSKLQPYPFAAVVSPSGITCTAVATHAMTISSIAKSTADAVGAPQTVSQPAPSKPISIVTPDGQEVTAPASMQTSAVIGMANPTLGSPILILLLGGLAYYLFHESKKGKRGASRASRATTKRGSRSARSSRRRSSTRRRRSSVRRRRRTR